MRTCGINRSFFGAPVLKNAQLEAPPEEVHILLGENGAGKSTLVKILSGACGQEDGDTWLDGRELAPMTSEEVLNAGISVIYQEFNLAPDLPVYEGVFIGKEYGQGVLVDYKRAIKEAKGYMRRVGLEVSPRTLVHELNMTQKRLMEIAKATSNHVRILVPGEPIVAITDKEANILFGITQELQKKKVGIIYISYRTGELFGTGDRCTVMRGGGCTGTVKLSGPSEDGPTKMMVRRTVSFEKIANEAASANQVVLRVENLRYKGFSKGISFELHKSEILGFAGLTGAGRTETAKCTIGAYRKNGGIVTYKGETLSNSLSRSVKKGIVHLSEDKKDERLVLMHSVMDNIALLSLEWLVKPFIRKREMADRTEDYIKNLRTKTHTYLMEAGNLSGGNQQKVIIVKWLYSNADVYIFDESTRGIDVGVRDEIYSIMYDLVNQGASIITISSDLVGVLKMCDWVAVMRKGILEAILDNDPDLT